MARLTAEFKRGVLRAIYRQAQNSGPTPLADALNSLQDQVFGSVQSGRVVTDHTGAGKAVKFIVPQIWQTLSQEEMFSFSEELQALYASALTTLGISQPTDASQDANIFGAMIGALPTITEKANDYSSLRWPTRL